ncbi:MAG: ribonuclease P protein component [Planctomycetes bacterium]|nr:ribonuclease P protein component [Planctomycetota bacterium]
MTAPQPAPSADAPRGAAFRPHERLRRKRDFDAAYAQGRKRRDDTLLLVVRPNGLPHSRLGVVVSKKAHGKRAVDRNRVKRVVREAFRLHKHALRGGLDIVCIPHAPRRGPVTCQAVARSLLRLVGRPSQVTTDH